MTFTLRGIKEHLKKVSEKKLLKILDLKIFFLINLEPIKKYFYSIIKSKVPFVDNDDLKYLEKADLGSEVKEDSYNTITDVIIRNFLLELDELLVSKEQKEISITTQLSSIEAEDNIELQRLKKELSNIKKERSLSDKCEKKLMIFLQLFNDKLVDYLKHIDTDTDDSKFKEIFMDTETFLQKNKGYLILYYLSTKGSDITKNVLDCIKAIHPFSDDDEISDEISYEISDDDEISDDEISDEKSKEYYYFLLMNNFRFIKIDEDNQIKMKDKDMTEDRFINLIDIEYLKHYVFLRNLIRIYLDLIEIIDEEMPRKMILTVLELILTIINKGKNNYSEVLQKLREFKYNDDLFYIHSLNYISNIFKDKKDYDLNLQFFINFVENTIARRIRADRYLFELEQNKLELKKLLFDYVKNLNERQKYTEIFEFIHSIPYKPFYLLFK